MPRQTDHEARRLELAETVLALILEHGIASVSVRTVAARSGWSVGALRYYYPRQEDLLTAVVELIKHKMLVRVLQPFEQSTGNPVEDCLVMLYKGLPIDQEPAEEFRLIIAFLDLSRFHPEVASLISTAWELVRHACRAMIARLAGTPTPPPGGRFEDPRLESQAKYLHIFWDGLSFQGLISPTLLDGEGMKEACQIYLRRISGEIAGYSAAS